MRRAAPWIAIVGALLVIALLGRGGDEEGEPLDPRSTSELGARGLVLLLEESGIEVDLTTEVPTATDTVVVVLRDELSDPRRDQLRRWVEGGGTAVIADPLSDLVPAIERRVGGLFEQVETGDDGRVGADADCDLPVVSKVGRIQAPGLVPYRVPAGATGCFPVGRGHAVAFLPTGDGTVVAVGGGAVLVNAYLDETDNAVLAVSLMGQTGRVAVLERSEAGTGTEDLFDLIGDGVKRGFWQLVVAFVLVALWRARRLGQPVLEPQPAEIEGSELVTAMGRLLETAGKREQAAAMLRLHLRRSLAERLGVPMDAPAAAAVDAAAALGLDRSRVERVLTARAVPSDDDLLRVATDVAALRSELIHAR